MSSTVVPARAARRAFLCAPSLLALALAGTAGTLPVDYDADFGAGGVATLPYASAGVGIVLPYRGIVLAVVGQDRASKIIRVTPAGTIDPAFMPIVGAAPEAPYFAGTFDGLAALPDGRFAASHAQFGMHGLCRSSFTRHFPEGSRDPAFSGATTACSTGLATTVDGELYAGATPPTLFFQNEWTGVLRIGPTGTPVDYLAVMDRNQWGALPWTYGKAVLPSDRHPVVLARPAVTGLGAVRLLADRPDPAYGTGCCGATGLAIVQPAEPLVGLDIALGADDSAFVAGHEYPNRQPQAFFVAKFKADGRPDPSFGSGGLARIAVARTDEQLSGVALAVQPDGKVLLAGNVQPYAATSDGFHRVALARLTITGAPDAHFAPGGVASLSLDRGTTLGFLALRPEGRILLGLTRWSLGAAQSSQAAVVQLMGGDAAGARPLRERLAVEYFHAGYGHYFVSADGEEITRLDATPVSGWTRTGQAFPVWDEEHPSLAPVCRFWSDQTWAPKSSHFYTHDEGECAKVKADPAWVFERNAFMVRKAEGPGGARTCPTGSQPLYRAYNRGMGGASNHRYTTDPAILDAMIGQGWVMEGEAATRVFACVPVPAT